MTAMQINLARKLESLKSDLARNEKILADGGFRDADGNWIVAGERQAEVARLREMASATERKLAEYN